MNNQGATEILGHKKRKLSSLDNDENGESSSRFTATQGTPALRAIDRLISNHPELKIELGLLKNHILRDTNEATLSRSKLEEELWNFKIEAAQKSAESEDDVESPPGVEEAHAEPTMQELQEKMNANATALKNKACLLEMSEDENRYLVDEIENLNQEIWGLEAVNYNSLDDKRELRVEIQNLEEEILDLKDKIVDLKDDIERLEEANDILELRIDEGDSEHCDICDDEIERLRTELEILGSTNVDMLKEKLEEYQDQLKELGRLDEVYSRGPSPRQKHTLDEWLLIENPEKQESLRKMVQSFEREFGTEPSIGKSLLVGVRLREKLDHFQKLWQEVLDFHADNPAEPQKPIHEPNQALYYYDRFQESKRLHRRMNRETRKLALLDDLKDNNGTDLAAETEAYDKLRHRVDKGIAHVYSTRMW